MVKITRRSFLFLTFSLSLSLSFFFFFINMTVESKVVCSFSSVDILDLMFHFILTVMTFFLLQKKNKRTKNN